MRGSKEEEEETRAWVGEVSDLHILSCLLDVKKRQEFSFGYDRVLTGLHYIQNGRLFESFRYRSNYQREKVDFPMQSR